MPGSQARIGLQDRATRETAGERDHDAGEEDRAGQQVEFDAPLDSEGNARPSYPGRRAEETTEVDAAPTNAP